MSDDDVDVAVRAIGDLGLQEHDEAERALLARLRRDLPPRGPEPSLRAARPSRRRRARAVGVRTVMLGAAAAVVISVLVAFTGTDSSSRSTTGVLAEAEAAIAPTGRIVHTVITTNAGTDNARQTEEWSATDPVRRRTRQVLPADDAPAGTPNSSFTLTGPSGRVVGVVESSHRPGEDRTFYAEDNLLEINKVPSDQAGSSDPGSIGAGTDPVTGLREALRAGRAVDDGLHQAQGQAVRRITTVETYGPNDTLRWTYDVDPSSFVPRQATMRRDSTAGGRPVTVEVTYTIDKFERFPDDDAHRRLLTITTQGQPRVVTGRSTRPPQG